MATVVRSRARRTQPPAPPRAFGPDSAGTLMTPAEFDRADFEEGWNYELIHGVLVVSPPALINERDPNEELGHLLRTYQETHKRGRSLDATVPEQTVATGENRRRADRAIWAGLGRLPGKDETPTIIAEFVSRGRRDRILDYEEKRDEYLGIGVREYWVIDRFASTMTVFTPARASFKQRVLRPTQTYKTPLLHGFALPLDRLLTFAQRWAGDTSGA